MTILQKLINAMLQRIEAMPVPQQELDGFLAQNQIQLSPEHYRFLLDYGNSPFLTHDDASRKKSYPICRINPLQICCTMCNSVSKHQTRLDGGFNLWRPPESTEEPPVGN